MGLRWGYDGVTMDFHCFRTLKPMTELAGSHLQFPWLAAS
jgi:hypothetical protein